MIPGTNQHTEQQSSSTNKNACEQTHGCHQHEGSEHCNCNCAAYGRVCPTDARAAGKAACRRVQSILKDSRLFIDGEPSFRRIQASEITLGQRLGEGGFSYVHACELKGADPTAKLAIKYLKRRIMVERKTFEYAASDLANEAFFLGRLQHANIIHLYGITEGKFEDNISTGMDAGLFIVLDQLVETLDKRLEQWRASANRAPHGIFSRMSNAHKETQRKSLIERLEVALDIAKVMHYLHSLDVIFRDLKPDNVGFDEQGVLKLFDFGLAKELKDSAKTTDGRYRMSGHTGSRRYMSPEGMIRVFYCIWGANSNKSHMPCCISCSRPTVQQSRGRLQFRHSTLGNVLIRKAIYRILQWETYERRHHWGRASQDGQQSCLELATGSPVDHEELMEY
jgi:serine/threonine protein kinase